MSTLSVIVSTYQHGRTLQRTLDSILAQTRMPDEILVIDDGSTDRTHEMVKAYKGRLVYVYQEHEGAPSARNHGFQRSTGDLVLFCDADVVMKPSMLKQLEEALQANPHAAYAYCRFRWGWKAFPCQPFDPDALRERNFIHTSAALIRRETFPGFDPVIKKFQDWDVWLTMLEQGHTGVFVDQELYLVRQDRHRFNMSSWLPSFVYAIPWDKILWKPKRIQMYDQAAEVIHHKHNHHDV